MQDKIVTIWKTKYHLSIIELHKIENVFQDNFLKKKK